VIPGKWKASATRPEHFQNPIFKGKRILIISDKKLIQLCDSCHINNGNRKEMENIIDIQWVFRWIFITIVKILISTTLYFQFKISENLTHYWKVKTKVDLCSIIIVEKIQEALLFSFLDFTKKSWMGTNNIVPTLFSVEEQYSPLSQTPTTLHLF
jgi:hypothetical protein